MASLPSDVVDRLSSLERRPEADKMSVSV